ncbi:MAG TPA: glutathione peroxidase [Niallia sp.]|nr:glutathione peroxidase [Niallia sp.]
MSIYNYLVKKPNGEILSMETFRNKVLLIVNTASHCEFTYQYEDLQKMHERYAEKGFTVLSFPCNQFGDQNPEDGVTTATQCKLQFGVTYPVFDKINVNGDQTHPLFNYLKHEVDCPPIVRETLQQKIMYNGIEKNFPEFLIGRNIRWNFTKFLVDQNGKVLQRFEPDSSFLDIEKAIEALF